MKIQQNQRLNSKLSPNRPKPMAQPMAQPTGSRPRSDRRICACEKARISAGCAIDFNGAKVGEESSMISTGWRCAINWFGIRKNPLMAHALEIDRVDQRQWRNQWRNISSCMTRGWWGVERPHPPSTRHAPPKNRHQNRAPSHD